MVILGGNWGYDCQGAPADNGGSALYADGVVVGAIAEERVTRRKHAPGFLESSRYLLEMSGLQWRDVDVLSVSFYQHPCSALPQESTLVGDFSGSEGAYAAPMLHLVRSHHLSHAASAFYQSPFERALVCVWDNEGSITSDAYPLHTRTSERHSYYIGEGDTLKLLDRELDGSDDVGFGQAYARVTSFAGLGSYTSAGKLMGLAGWGDPRRFKELGPFWVLRHDGRLHSVLRRRDRQYCIPLLFARAGLLAPERGTADGHRRQEIRDLAAYCQAQLEDAAIERVRALLKRTHARALCISGGVALNSVLNSRLQNMLDVPVFVPPHPDDTGQALGNVILAVAAKGGGACAQDFRSLGNALGGSFSDCEVHRRLSSCAERLEHMPEGAAVRAAARAIARGEVIGWFQGRSEYGARALGHRSVLADPRTPGMQDTVNRKKGRELFRPVAPAVTAEAASQFFVMRDSPLWATMSGTVQVRAEAKDVIPAAVHADGTARVQIVERERQPKFHQLLTEIHAITGVPVVLNTSFNGAGEPIVETPEDALRSAKAMRLDRLFVENTMVLL